MMIKTIQRLFDVKSSSSNNVMYKYPVVRVVVGFPILVGEI